MGNSYHICCCQEFGCANEKFELEGVVHRGKYRNRQNGVLHETALRRLRSKEHSLHGEVPRLSSAIPSQTRRRSLSTGNMVAEDAPNESHLSTTRLMRRRSSSLDNRRASSSSFTIFSTAPFRIQKVFLQRPSCLIAMLNVAYCNLVKNSGHDTSRHALFMARVTIAQSLKDAGYTGRPYWEDLPKTLSTLYTMLNLDVKLTSQTCCPECFALHDQPPAKANQSYQLNCNNMRFIAEIDAPRGTPVIRRPCNKALYSSDLKPFRQFHYQSLRTWLAQRLFVPGFEAALDASLQHKSDGSRMTDIWDGSMWKSFEQSGKTFTSTSGNLIFGLYVDWFNPHGRGCQRRRSHGNITLICYNLHPSIRCKQENLFLFGIVPGPKEPKLEQTNELLKPLVAEFQDFWNGIFFTSTPNHPNGRVIRAAVWPLIADLIAMRKIAGFASHSSKNFCSQCALTIQDSQNTDISSWPKRLQHQIHAERWRDAPTEQEQTQIFQTHGVRYTVLSQLPYWRPIEFVTVDAMHCILLGLLSDHARSFMRVEQAGKMLTAEARRSDKRPRASPNPHESDDCSSSSPPEPSSSSFQYRDHLTAGNISHLNSSRSDISTTCGLSSQSNASGNNNSATVSSQVSKKRQRPSELQSQNDQSNRNKRPKPAHLADFNAGSSQVSKKRGRPGGLNAQPDFDRTKRLKLAHSPELASLEDSIRPSSSLSSGRSSVSETASYRRSARLRTQAEASSRIEASGSSTKVTASRNISPSHSLQRSSRIPPSHYPRRSSRLQNQTASNTSGSIQKRIPSQRKKNRQQICSSSESTVRGSRSTQKNASRMPANAAKSAGPSARNIHPGRNRNRADDSNPMMTMSDLKAIQHVIKTTKTPTWMTRPPINVGMASAGTPKASEWLTFYTVYIVLSLIPQLFFSEDAKRQTLCHSLIQIVEITNCALSRSFSKEDGDDLQQMLKNYREHLAANWKGISFKPNLHMAQHLPEIALLYGPPASTAGWSGEQVNGDLVKTPKNHKETEVDKSMMEHYLRKGSFRAVVKAAPTFLSQADEDIRQQILERLTGVPSPSWSAESTLDSNTYSIWVRYLNHDLNQRYGKFSESNNTACDLEHVLSSLVQITQRYNLRGKDYTAESLPGEGNNTIEYSVRGKCYLGRIQYIFRTESIPTVFFVVKPYIDLTSEDSTKNFFLSYPRLHAGIIYSKTGSLVVVDSQDLIGHSILVKNPPRYLGIEEETLSFVGLKNFSAIIADSSKD